MLFLNKYFTVHCECKLNIIIFIVNCFKLSNDNQIILKSVCFSVLVNLVKPIILVTFIYVFILLKGPKKNAKKKGGGAKAKAPTIVDGISTEEMTKEQVFRF